MTDSDRLSQFIPSVTMIQADYEDTRCGQKFDGYPCRKRVGHKGHHYADTNNDCGVGWGNLNEDGYPND